LKKVSYILKVKIIGSQVWCNKKAWEGERLFYRAKPGAIPKIVQEKTFGWYVDLAKCQNQLRSSFVLRLSSWKDCVNDAELLKK